ncbi:unnamed protein product [Fraxinus pennsylvanica]|uniref:Cytochrome P450 n=1 Tax=Fraxinus pennsylvanica TaxID=56036 RepID=A0AAD2DJD5_9LAMI|nr:unnamed protein product [Fraxinus pennsylvanica]
MISFQHLIVPLASFIFSIFLFKWHFNSASTARKRLPPSPSTLPVIGNLHQLGLYPHRSLRALSKHYGSLMMLHLGSVPTLIVSSADAAREIMKNHDMVFLNRPKINLMDKIVYGCKDIAFSPYGEHWRQVRTLCVLQLLSNRRVHSFRRIRDEETALMMEKIRQSCSSSTASINLSNLLVSLTSDIICRVALGRKYSDGEESNKFGLMLKEVGALLGTFNPGDYIPWLKWIKRVDGFNVRVEKLAKSLDEFLDGVVEEHRNQKKGKADGDDSTGEADLVDILLQIQRENKAGFPIGTDTIKAVIFDMFAAGTDTTYITLEWAVAELLKHLKTMEKLQNEVRQVAGSKLEIIEDDLDKMSYMKAVIKETLRLHPPLPLLLPRESTQDTKVMGYDIAVGTRVMINAWAIARDQMSWENPEEFQPERFCNTVIDFKGLNFEFIPFGAGRRGCPGITFAMGVVELALAKLMHKFNFTTEKHLDMTEASGAAVYKKFPLLVIPRPDSC